MDICPLAIRTIYPAFDSVASAFRARAPCSVGEERWAQPWPGPSSLPLGVREMGWIPPRSDASSCVSLAQGSDDSSHDERPCPVPCGPPLTVPSDDVPRPSQSHRLHALRSGSLPDRASALTIPISCPPGLCMDQLLAPVTGTKSWSDGSGTTARRVTPIWCAISSRS